MQYVIGWQYAYFAKEHSDANKNYDEDDFIKMLYYLIDNISVDNYLAGRSHSLVY